MAAPSFLHSTSGVRGSLREASLAKEGLRVSVGTRKWQQWLQKGQSATCTGFCNEPREDGHGAAGLWASPLIMAGRRVPPAMSSDFPVLSTPMLMVPRARRTDD